MKKPAGETPELPPAEPPTAPLGAGAGAGTTGWLPPTESP